MNRRDIVVIGASAGGVRALRLLAAQLPQDFPAAVCVALHVGAHPSSLPQLLSAAGPNPALHPAPGQRLEAGRIYVAPPDHHLIIAAGAIQLTRGPKEHHARPAIDPMFRSAALGYGPRVVGVLLTGLLDDGAAGLQAIQSCGGLTVVQDPADAEEPAMPRAALRAVAVDHCLPLADIGPLLARLVRQAAGEAVAPPGRLVHEYSAGLEGEGALRDLKAVATPSTFVCPECQGALWEVEGAQSPRYRCYTGHAFTLRTLADAQEERTDEALWSAIRALHEKTLLMRKVAALDHAAGDHERGAAGEAEVQRIEQQMALLRRLVEGG